MPRSAGFRRSRTTSDNVASLACGNTTTAFFFVDEEPGPNEDLLGLEAFVVVDDDVDGGGGSCDSSSSAAAFRFLFEAAWPAAFLDLAAPVVDVVVTAAAPAEAAEAADEEAARRLRLTLPRLLMMIAVVLSGWERGAARRDAIRIRRRSEADPRSSSLCQLARQWPSRLGSRKIFFGCHLARFEDSLLH
jgi:hypothetical protein